LVIRSRASNVSSVGSLRRSFSVGSRQGFFMVPSWLIGHAIYSRHDDSSGSKLRRFLPLCIMLRGCPSPFRHNHTDLKWPLSVGKPVLQPSLPIGHRALPNISDNCKSLPASGWSASFAYGTVETSSATTCTCGASQSLAAI
jgi:hypothetical protein